MSAGVAATVVERYWDPAWALRWGLSLDMFQATFDASIGHAFVGQHPAPKDIERYATSLHLADLALASACAAGLEPAWDHFVREYRPLLYRAADAIDASGGARDLADALFADLFGLRERDGVRQSLFRYFHGRSSLATWLRAVLSQRHVDHLRAGYRLDPLPDADARPAASALPLRPAQAPDPDRRRYLDAIRTVLTAAIAGLAPRDRLRLTLYYAQDLTLSAIGRLLNEHEATVSRHLTRTRRTIRGTVEQCLRSDHGFDEPSIAECFQSIVDDVGPLDMTDLLGATPDAVLNAEHLDAPRKNKSQDRSK